MLRGGVCGIPRLRQGRDRDGAADARLWDENSRNRVDEDGKPYEIEAADGATVAIDGALWRGEIRLIPPYNRKTSDNGVIKSATPDFPDAIAFCLGRHGSR
jgi:hypothetical protein